MRCQGGSQSFEPRSVQGSKISDPLLTRITSLSELIPPSFGASSEVKSPSVMKIQGRNKAQPLAQIRDHGFAQNANKLQSISQKNQPSATEQTKPQSLFS